MGRTAGHLAFQYQIHLSLHRLSGGVFAFLSPSLRAAADIDNIESRVIVTLILRKILYLIFSPFSPDSIYIAITFIIMLLVQ